MCETTSRRGFVRVFTTYPPDHLIAVIAPIGRIDSGALRKSARDVVDTLLVIAARIDDRQLAKFLAARNDAAPVRGVCANIFLVLLSVKCRRAHFGQYGSDSDIRRVASAWCAHLKPEQASKMGIEFRIKMKMAAWHFLG
jgi:hypothetical protein